ncbi:cytochrome P450 [Streptomyces sp. Go40/10]|uniref:cytochrome P450 n=1 Tax=Streptomyces sp. Go40/10 TaxID=2825844 RepID=UPI001E55B2A5|nr:cytochrome P450 [Streptomyces sp. Go40/10]UFQ99920.1 cytochrome P450 [Streptomyces sp. Go40/10]
MTSAAWPSLPAGPACPHPRLLTGEPALWDASAAFTALRERAPVQQVVLPGELVAWLVTGATEARAALTDDRLAHDMRRLPDPEHGFGGRRYPDDLFAAEGRHLLNSDGSDHRRLRSVLAPLLSKTAAQRWRAYMAATCAELLNGMAAAGHGDLVTGYARPLAVQVTAAVLGIPAGPLPRLTDLTLAVIAARDPKAPAMRERKAELFGLWARILGAKAREPADDVLTRLVLARAEGRVTAEELLSVAWGLFSGGISPTTTLITSSAVEIMRRPGLRQQLRKEHTAVQLTEELVRLISPFLVSTWRFTLDDIHLGSTVIPRGSVVLIALKAANHDPAHFPHPDTVDLYRSGHLSFGLGAHYCPGAPLARLQATEALTALFTQFPDLRLTAPETALRRTGLLVEHGYRCVPVRTRSTCAVRAGS